MTFIKDQLSGGNPRTLKGVDDVVTQVLRNQKLLSELFRCMFNNDEIVRMRAGDALEKIARVKPTWLKPYINRLLTAVTKTNQPSVQWHTAQILGEVELTAAQRSKAISILTANLKDTTVDWIVAHYSMETMVKFAVADPKLKVPTRKLLQLQESHHSKAVAKKASKLLAQLV